MPPPRVSFTPTPSSAIVHWFRRDLRTTDNLALNRSLALCKSTKSPLIPLFLLDPDFHSPSNCGPVRMRFLLESLTALQASLLQKSGAHLRIISARATDIFPELVRRWNISHLCWEYEYAPNERQRDAAVQEDVAALGVKVYNEHGFTLYKPQFLLEHATDGKAPVTMGAFLSLVERAGDPKKAVSLNNNNSISLLDCPSAMTEQDKADGYFDIPTLSEVGHNEVPGEEWERFPGGEAEGMKRMKEFFAREGGRVAARFAKPETSPAAFRPRDTTVLSPYLALGCLSCRVFHERLRELEERFKVAAMPQTRLWGQLMWREHFWLLAGTVKNFDRIEGNVLCRRIPWESSEERLKRWREGRTGYPWIDALMTQLRTEGFVHHLGRHSLACFLTRGDLWISWEDGYRVFEYFLVDYDYALNSANWMWLSCSAFFVMYYRVYSPVAFAKKWDKDGEFVRRYLPVLKGMPTKYIHEPWKAPKEVQRRAGCIVGIDYPERIVIHEEVSKQNIQRMKEAYAKNEFGAPSVSRNMEKPQRRSDGNGTRAVERRSKKRKVK